MLYDRRLETEQRSHSDGVGKFNSNAATALVLVNTKSMYIYNFMTIFILCMLKL